MVLRRYIPILIVGFFGSFTLFGWFINNETVEAFINDDATQWYDIIASFAIFLGALNFLKLQFLKVLKRQSGWQYSVVAIVSFFAVFIIGFFMRGAFIVDIPATDVQETYFTQKSAEEAIVQLKDSGVDATITPAPWGAHIQTEGGLFKWMFDNVFTPLSATMFALLAFYVASASYRAFRARNFEATLLLLAGIIIMIGRVPAGGLISSWMIMYMLVLVLGIIVNTYFRHRQIVFGVVALGLNFGYNRITISTAGIVPKINQFIEDQKKYNLAISLNASNDKIRNEIMPINEKWPISELLKISKKFNKSKKNKITFEYVLIDSVNDSESDAIQLCELLKNSHCKLNIIPFNYIGNQYKRPSEDKINNFIDIVHKNHQGFRILVRWSKGIDINAGCGQLSTKEI